MRLSSPVSSLGIAALLLTAAAAPATAQVVASDQTLDRVFAYDAANVLNLAVGNADPAVDFTNIGVSGTSVVTCTVTPVSGLFCLDGNKVNNWPNPLQPATVAVVANCADNGYGLAANKGEVCTAMTVDASGAIWLGARKKNAHSVFKVVKKPAGGCTAAVNGVAVSGDRCAKELYSGRPALVDLVAIDGTLAANFRPTPGSSPQSGVIGIEERKHAVFFRDAVGVAAITVVSAQDWDLKGSELLQDIAVVALPGSTYPIETTVLATTAAGRVMARSTTLTGKARQVFNFPNARAARSPAPVACSAATSQYGVRVSPTTDIIYASDSQYCEVLALLPDSSALNSLVYAGSDPILSTNAPPETHAVVGLTVTSGITIDMRDCKINCTVLNGQGGDPAAQLLSVDLASGSNSAVTLFQIKEIPDCRHPADLSADKLTVCVQKSSTTANSVVIDPAGNGVLVLPNATLGSSLPAAAMRLNVTPLLPDEVVMAFNASGLRAGGLPQILMSRQYVAQPRNDRLFEALFLVPQPNVRYTGTFEGEFWVEQLEGVGEEDVLGCTEDGSGNLIEWDIASYVSELFGSVGGNFIDTLVNKGCGSIRIVTGRASMLPYDLMVNPDTYEPAFGSGTVPVSTPGNDAVFARLLQSLYGDLKAVQLAYACTNADAGSGQAPLSNNVCNSLTSTWNNGKTKLDKCIEAAFQPKSSASNENCQSWVSQMTNYRNSLPANTAAQDVANRSGELKARIETIFHLYYTRVLPSMPQNGFCRERNVPGCANPWY